MTGAVPNFPSQQLPSVLLAVVQGRVGVVLQADYALSRLVALKDRTEATESLAKMHLAQRRNELVSFDLMMTVISINIGFFGAVAALCGMNLWLAGSNAPKVIFSVHMLQLFRF